MLHGATKPDGERILIARAQCGDVAARNELISRHWRLICRLARRHGGADGCEDRRQEAILDVIAAIEGFDLGRPVKLSTYLGWRMRRSLTASPRHDRTMLAAMDEADPRDGIAEVDQADELDRMSSAFDALNPLDRAILDLRHRQGLPASVIARKLGRKPSVIRDLERIALTRLRMLMGAS
jgi:RNA polymerase sigma factor (sigma-70 family)